MLFPPHHLQSLFQRSTALPHLLQLHSLLLKAALDHHPFLAAKLISSLIPLSLLHAHSLFSHLHSPPALFAFNSLIRAYATSRSPLESIRLFSELLGSGIRPDKFTYPFVIKACGRTSMPETGRAVHGSVIKVGLLSDSYVSNSLLHLYSCCGMVGWARKMFDEMCERDVVSWSTMIEGYVACNLPLQALMMLRQMRLSNITPNSVTVVSLLSASCQLCNLSIGRSIHSYIAVNNIELDVALGTALVSMYAKCGQIKEAFQVFNSMEEKNLQSWTIMISGVAGHGCFEEVIALFSQMEASSIKPDSKLFSCILSACSHLGMVDEGWKYFNRMVNEFNIQPTMEHYGCMVDLLARAGHVRAAREFIKNMPVRPNSIILRSFMGPCRMHGESCDIELHKLMSILLNEEPELGSNYVLAAEVSALTSKWSEVAKLRGSMTERGLKKTPGYSWMEVTRV
ncbi:pentatricopeptide repeat-containing protein At2g02980, chloroplastic-like [Typha latifolia]|uniref:pentatricopeptide repeat-containing protein At2g02980, chloroplastic-like n=1 Tax=Typha latifolia TaxID=4733 RepID=UPI003C2F903E